MISIPLAFGSFALFVILEIVFINKILKKSLKTIEGSDIHEE